MEIQLNEKFLKYEKGHVFEVIKDDSKAYVAVSIATGARAIVPKAKCYVRSGGIEDLSGETGRKTIYLTPEQEKALEALKDMDVPSEKFDELVDLYSYESSLPEDEAILDLMRLKKAMEDGTVFVSHKSRGSGKVAGEGMTMTPEEVEVLEKLMRGESLVDSKGVSRDTKPEAKPEPPPELKENQIWLTDITGGRLPSSGKNHIIDQYPEDHFPEDQRVFIPKVNEHHFWNPDVLEALVISYKLNEKMLITGPPGTGKSTSVEQFAAWIRQPYTRIGGRGDLESADIIGMGYLLPDEESGSPVTVWKDGRLSNGIRNNHLINIDEIMKIPSYIQMAMQHLYEKDGYLALDGHPGDASERILKPGAEVRLFFTDNVKGTGDSFDKYSATQIQDTSTLDRININVSLPYLSGTDERKMLMGMFPEADEGVVKKLIQFANLVRNSFNQGQIAITLSPRGLITVLKIMKEVGLPLNSAIDLAFTNKIADVAELEAVKSMKSTCRL